MGIDIPYGVVSIFAYPGCSGSPVLNQDGELIGMLVSYATDVPHHIGMMVPITTIKEEMEKI